MDLFGAEQVVDCEGWCDLLIPVVRFPDVDGSPAYWSRRGVVEVCGRFALPLVCLAVCFWDLDVEAIAGVSCSAIALGAAGAGRLGDGKLAGVEKESVRVGSIEESFFLFKRSFLLLDEVDGSFANALFHGAVLFDCDGDGEVVLFLESVDFGLEAVLSKKSLSICSLICI